MVTEGTKGLRLPLMAAFLLTACSSGARAPQAHAASRPAPIASPAPVAGSRTAPRAKPAAGAAAAPPAVPSAAGIKPAVYLKGPRHGAGLEVWQLGAGGESDRSLGFTADRGSAGQTGIGTVEPALSPDGSWLAFLRDGKLWVRRLDAQREQQLTKYPEKQVRVLISGWSPDSKMLLFHQGQQNAEDGAQPLPPDVPEGFYLLRTADLTARHVPGLEGFGAWEPDSRHVIYEELRDTSHSALMRKDIEERSMEKLTDSSKPYTYSNLSLHGDEMAYVLADRIVRSKLNGTGVVDVTPAGAPSEYQRPAYSPDGKRVAYLHRTEANPAGRFAVEVSEISTGHRGAIARCQEECPFAWQSATQLLVQHGDELRRVDLSGVLKVVATGVATFAVAQ